MVLAVSAPLASAASTVPMSRPKLGADAAFTFVVTAAAPNIVYAAGVDIVPILARGRLCQPDHSQRWPAPLAGSRRDGLCPPVRLLEHRLDEVATGPGIAPAPFSVTDPTRSNVLSFLGSAGAPRLAPPSHPYSQQERRQEGLQGAFRVNLAQLLRNTERALSRIRLQRPRIATALRARHCSGTAGRPVVIVHQARLPSSQSLPSGPCVSSYRGDATGQRIAWLLR